MKNRKSLSKKEKRQRFNLTIVLALMIFCVLFVTLILISITSYILIRMGVLTIFGQNITEAKYLLPFMVITSIIIGGIVSIIITTFPLAPFEHFIHELNRLASGDYKARIKFGKSLVRLPGLDKLENSFNTMAEELQNTQMLRSDFVNNFSHEFKTPIVSIAGFAKLLRKGNLTEEQKEEYLAIIEKESLRLSAMATNVLNLTRVENQSILTEISTYNLSEQLRACTLLFESKWEQKNLKPNINFGEHNISANEELLKQVWINLIDNAVKFSPKGGILEIGIDENKSELCVTISNNGDTIQPENIKKIFNKFYQADESHFSEGNGIGLAIVKSIVELHNGTVSVKSENNLTSFIVKLPKTH